MPDAVKTADNRRLGSHEGQGHPYQEDGVLLAHCLAGSHLPDLPTVDTLLTWLVVSAYIAASSKLKGTAYQRDQRHQQKKTCGQVCVDYGPCGYSNGKGKGDSPDIERKVRMLKQSGVKSRSQITYQPCTEARSDKQREHL